MGGGGVKVAVVMVCIRPVVGGLLIICEPVWPSGKALGW